MKKFQFIIYVPWKILLFFFEKRKKTDTKTMLFARAGQRAISLREGGGISSACVWTWPLGPPVGQPEPFSAVCLHICKIIVPLTNGFSFQILVGKMKIDCDTEAQPTQLRHGNSRTWLPWTPAGQPELYSACCLPVCKITVPLTNGFPPQILINRMKNRMRRGSARTWLLGTPVGQLSK